MIDLGEYIAVLATEYKLLNEQNQDVTATANEPYHALNALDRLDLFWERYFNPYLSTGSANGFLVRDDYNIIRNNQKKSALELFCCFT